MSSARPCLAAALTFALLACGGDPVADAGLDLDGGPTSTHDANAPVEDGGSPATDGGGDAGSVFDAGLDAGPADAGGPWIEISEPLTDVVTDAPSIAIGVLVHGGVADRVELHVDDVPLAAVGPPYRHIWDISTEEERSHVVVAHAWFGSLQVSSAARTITIDRSPPEIVSIAPAPGDPLDLGAPIVVTFDEPISLASVGTDSRLASDTGVIYDGVYTVDGTGTELTIELTGPDGQSSGDVTLVLDGIEDASGHALGDASAVWPTPVWLPLGELPGSGTPTVLRVSNSGSLYAARRGYGSFTVARWNGSSWDPLGVTPCGPVPTGNPVRSEWDFELDHLGEPVVALTEYVEGESTETRVCTWDGASWVADRSFTHGFAGGIDLHVDPTGTLTLAISTATETHVFEHGASGWSESLPAPPAYATTGTRAPIVGRDAGGQLRLMLPSGTDNHWYFARPDAASATGWLASPLLIGRDPVFLGVADPVAVARDCTIAELTTGWDHLTPTFTLASYGTRTCHSTADPVSGRWVVMVREFGGFTGQVAWETSHGSFSEVGMGGLDISNLLSLDVAFHDERPTLAVNGLVLRFNYIGSFAGP